jgi:flavin reductase (DIM6/NTAB) family NADH-FMN oxidoreductase RutF
MSIEQTQATELVHQEAGDIASVLELMPYGMYAVGSARADTPNMMIADWVMQVSFQPHLVAIAFEDDSHSLESIRQNRLLTINLLTVDQLPYASQFVQPLDGRKVKGRTRGAAHIYDKLEGVSYRPGPGGAPILTDALAWMTAEALEFIAAGDHTVVIAHITDASIQRSGEPLTSVNSGWSYAG